MAFIAKFYFPESVEQKEKISEEYNQFLAEKTIEKLKDIGTTPAMLRHCIDEYLKQNYQET